MAFRMPTELLKSTITTQFQTRIQHYLNLCYILFSVFGSKLNVMQLHSLELDDLVVEL